MTENSQRTPMKHTADIWSLALNGIPTFRGKVHITDTLARLAAIAGDGWGTCSPGNGATIRVNLSDRIERQMWGGCYEPHVQRSLRTLLAPGDTFIDIGAHVGYHAVLGASIVGSSGRVFAFEADPKNFARLEEHLHPFAWSTPANKAVWSTTGNVIFERSSQPGESGWGTLTAVRDLGRGDHVSVSTVSLDDWSLDHDVRSVSAMKIDAEGSEVSILRGANEFLRRTRPTIIVEANDVVLRQAKSSALELTEILRVGDFELYELDRATLQFLTSGVYPRTLDLLAVPAERARSVVTLFQRSGFRTENPKSASGSFQ
jgi:FkbM family methyltransferase